MRSGTVFKAGGRGKKIGEIFKSVNLVFTKLEQMTKFLMNTHASLQLLTTAQNGRIANNMYLF